MNCSPTPFSTSTLTQGLYQNPRSTKLARTERDFLYSKFDNLKNVDICIVFTPGVISLEQNWPSFHGTFKVYQFSREEFYYLNVTRVGIFTYYDLLDCIFECVRNTLCLSINVVAFAGADGKLWCELLSSDKYRNAENFKENISWHHFSIMVRILFHPFFFQRK